ncbi:MAG: phosphoribosylformylglycinamidine synthase subunit PurL [Armatimonadetes bacterium]|nr:phosphoribosylformylglycinamidine synthase subunit PurL [Armatimonadota bacterium]
MRTDAAVDAAFSLADVRAAGLRWTEYLEIRGRLGREPNRVELAMFGVMWSEHCAYKHSRRYLKLLPTQGDGVLQGPGENAGVVEVAPGIGVALKVESHNHPSAIDPFHGAATGVGGILRDVLSMGARPIAILDSLRFGSPAHAASRRLRDGVVSGIAHYGNAIGVPTVGGELVYEDRYAENPLVNAACIGIVRADRLARSAAAGPGNPVLYAGARTGRDGIGGAAFASDELDVASVDRDRSAVQIGDPFAGKSLIEATLAALDTGVVVAIQDMGAAGLTCATSEMSSKGGVGMRIDLARVPRREAGMTAGELLLSESQERMLLIVRQGEADTVAAIYRRWGLQAEVIGEVTAEPALRIYDGGTLVVDLPPESLTEAPAYQVPEEEPKGRALIVEAPESPRSVAEALLRVLGAPTVASKRAVFRQYDHMVQLNTVVAPGADAAVLRLKEAPPVAIAVAIDGNGRTTWLDAWAGGAGAASEAALNVACTGARPVAATDGLNFGSPEKPETAWDLHNAIAGIADACRAMRVPIVGGNVSLYNESPVGSIFPTPMVAVIGVLSDVSCALTSAFRDDGDLIVLIGEEAASLDGSEYDKIVRGRVAGKPVRVDVAAHARLVALLPALAADGLLQSAHDVSGGGLAVALAECCIAGHFGARCRISGSSDPELALFGEGPSRVVATVTRSRLAALVARCRSAGVPVAELGVVEGDALAIRAASADLVVGLDQLRTAWEG